MNKKSYLLPALLVLLLLACIGLTACINQHVSATGTTGKSLEAELAELETKEQALYDALNANESASQLDMNLTSREVYDLWDAEMASLLTRLNDELDADTKAKVLEEQEAWSQRKEQNVRGSGAMATGGSMQPLLENSTAAEMTRARSYILAGYLADARNESFTISPEVQESIALADPSLDDVFERFAGQWIFDIDRGACVGVERTEDCAYGVEGSSWTVWMTGGDLFSDLDVYGYTSNSILFKLARDDRDDYYELSFNMADGIILTYGTSLDAMNDAIVCDYRM